jgi:hypothetical protein
MLRRAVVASFLLKHPTFDAEDRVPCLGMLFLPHLAGLGVEV